MPSHSKSHSRSHSKSQNKSHSQSQNQNQNGGEGAAEYMEKVVGAPHEQKAGEHGNVIAMNPISGGSGLVALSPAVVSSRGNLISGGESVSVVPAVGYGDMSKEESASVGGRKRKGKGKRGGNLLNQLAVPAVLLYANNTFGRRRSAARKTRRFRGSRRSRK